MRLFADSAGGFDTITDSGSYGFDQILAQENGVEIGLSTSFSSENGIEVISGQSNRDVTIQGSDEGNVWDFSDVNLQNIASINSGDGIDVIIQILYMAVTIQISFMGKMETTHYLANRVMIF